MSIVLLIRTMVSASIFSSFSTAQKFDVKVVAERDSVEKRIFFKGAPQPDMVSYIQELRYQDLEGCKRHVIYLAVSTCTSIYLCTVDS